MTPRRLTVLGVLLVSTLVAACASPRREASPIVLALARGAPSTQPEATSLLGKPLVRPPLDRAREQELVTDLAIARSLYESHPGAHTLIWVGRRLGYLGRFKDAEAVFFVGCDEYPGSYRLRRHRGHRLITLRRFEPAVHTLREAASLASGKPDQIEPDGAPNSANQPRSTDKSNIHYHLGLALFLLGRYDESAEAFAQRRGLRRFNDDMLVSTVHWQYLALRRLGRDADAAAALEPIRPGLDVIENHNYHDLCLMYKGLKRPEDLAPSASGGSPTDAAVAFGVAAFLELQGNRAGARAIKESLVAHGHWASFGVIAAEADLAREAAANQPPPTAAPPTHVR